MSFEIKMILIYTIIFVIIGLFIWLYITTKNKKEEEKINRDIDFSNDNDDPDDDSLANYEDYVHRGLGAPKKSDEYVTDEIDDFINNFTYRDEIDTEKYEEVIEQNLDVNESNEKAREEVMEEAKNIPNNFDYTLSITPIKVTNTISEVLNVLIGNKAYIFLANGNKLNNGEKIILSIDDKNYPGVVVKSNYSRDLSALKILPKPLIVVKKID